MSTGILGYSENVASYAALVEHAGASRRSLGRL